MLTTYSLCLLHCLLFCEYKTKHYLIFFETKSPTDLIKWTKITTQQRMEGDQRSFGEKIRKFSSQIDHSTLLTGKN